MPIKTLFFACYCLLFSINLFSLTIPNKIQDLDIRLKDPHFEKNVLTTFSGGVIESATFRIQALHIRYDQKRSEIEAKGNLMVIFNKRIFIGDHLYYNVKEHTGILTQGKTFDNLWIIGGETITFHSNKSISIQNAFLTTSEIDPPDYAITASQLTLDHNGLLAAKRVKFHFKHVPLFYLPIFRMNLKESKNTRLKYAVTWDKGQGPKFSMRYRIYSWEHTDLFFRFDFRINRGFGGAFESDFHAKHADIRFQTKSYIAHDTFFADPDPNRRKTRWRLQGFGIAKSDDENTKALLRYDWISDRNMPQDFKTDDFELNTAKRTELFVNHMHPVVATDLYVRPNINQFQGFKQQLPTLKIDIHPLQLGQSKIMVDNSINASFLDYAYAKDLQIPLPGFHSLRLQTTQRAYRTFHLWGLDVTPSVSYRGILYSNTPQSQTIIENLLHYRIDTSSSLMRQFKTTTHVATPYIQFDSLRPMKNKHHFIFDLSDGYARIQQLKFGVRNDFYSSSQFGNPWFRLDCFGYQFLNTRQLATTIPKFGYFAELNLSQFSLFSNVIYNHTEALYDKVNFGLKWTLNAFFAIGLDFLHRSSFYYRKDDEDNFVLDTNISKEALLSTPISDSRNLFVAKTQLNIPPNWTIRFQAHAGWARADQPNYAEYRIDIFNMITSHWKVRLSLMKTTDTIEFSSGISLVSF